MPPHSQPPDPPSEVAHPIPERAAILRAVAGIGVYAAAFGATFGAVAVAAGLTVLQACVLSLVMFTGASQFAFVGVIGAGAAPFAAIPAALLLGVRNAFYGVPVTGIVQPRGPLQRLRTAQLVIDETTAMAVAQPSRAAGRLAFWATGLVLFGCWNAGTLAGAALGTAVDPAALGLDAAAPAVFLALLWPQLRRRGALPLALAGAAVAGLLVPVAPAGAPVIAAAVVAVAVGLLGPVEQAAGPEGPAPAADADRAAGERSHGGAA